MYQLMIYSFVNSNQVWSHDIFIGIDDDSCLQPIQVKQLSVTDETYACANKSILSRNSVI